MRRDNKQNMREEKEKREKREKKVRPKVLKGKRKTGRIVHIDMEKGFGFIKCEEYPERIFFRREWINKATVEKGYSVSCDVYEEKNGLVAKEITILSVSKSEENKFLLDCEFKRDTGELIKHMISNEDVLRCMLRNSEEDSDKLIVILSREEFRQAKHALSSKKIFEHISEAFLKRNLYTLTVIEEGHRINFMENLYTYCSDELLLHVRSTGTIAIGPTWNERMTKLVRFDIEQAFLLADKEAQFVPTFQEIELFHRLKQEYMLSIPSNKV